MGKKQQGLSLRYKILLLLTAVPVVTLAVFLFIALGIFEKDKVAYIFESSASVSRTLSSQVATDLNATLTAARPVFQDYLLGGQFGVVSKSLFEGESPLEVIAAFSFENNDAKKLGFAEKEAGEGDKVIQELGSLIPLFHEADLHSRILRVPFHDDRILIVEKIATPTGARYFLVISKLKSVAEIFRAPASSDIYLIDDKGTVLFGAPGTEATNISEKMGENFLERFRDQKFQTGTEEVLSKEGLPWLASFSKVSFGDYLMVVSLVPKREALKAVQILLRKSMVFFLLLISGTVMVSLVASGTLTSALTDLFQATKKVAEGKFDIRVNVKSKDEFGSLATSFNAMASEVSRLMLETAEKARMESELKTAQTVQETLFPATEAAMRGLRISGYYEPASECGGDWWHYCEVGSKVFLWIGDATGHGAPAALITSAAKSAATIIETLNVEPGAALNLLNRAIFDVSKGRIMMTFFLACYERETKMLTYANASHEAPYLIKVAEGTLKKKDLIPLNEVNNPRLGQSRETQYEQTTVQLDEGDRIFFYTDGIPDIQNPKLEAWGEREFIKGLLVVNKEYPPITDSVRQLHELFDSHRQGAPLIDDVTYFMVQVDGGVA